MTEHYLPLQKGVVYGPVRSRRLGNSLGINLSPGEIKMCSLNCSYCQYSWTGMLVRDARPFRHILPSPREVASALRERIEDSIRNELPIDHITFSGNGESTLHPDFPEIADLVLKIRDALVPGAKVACLSNSTTLSKDEIFQAVLRMDEPIMKLDAGNVEIFKRLNRPAAEIDFGAVVSALAGFKGRLTVQSLFVQGAVDNTAGEAIRDYIEAIKKIRPKSVQIYSLDRLPADKQLKTASKETLEKIKIRIEAEANASAVVY